MEYNITLALLASLIVFALHIFGRVIDANHKLDEIKRKMRPNEIILFERDMAIKQLEDIGLQFGENFDDVERVVRCKDCRFCNEEDGVENYIVCELSGKYMKLDGYCSDGYPRERV